MKTKRIEWRKGSGRFAEYNAAELAILGAFADQFHAGEITREEMLNQIDVFHELKIQFQVDISQNLAGQIEEHDEAQGRLDGRAARDESMRQVDTNTNPSAKKEIMYAIHSVALANTSLIADDVWVHLGWAPAEPRVMGPLMTAASDRGWIERVEGEHRQAHRVINHARPQQVWRSLIYEGDGRLPV